MCGGEELPADFDLEDFWPVVVTEGRDFNAGQPCGLQHGRAGRPFNRLTVDAQFHITIAAR